MATATQSSSSPAASRELVEHIGTVLKLQWVDQKSPDAERPFSIIKLTDGTSAKGNCDPTEIIPNCQYRFLGNWGADDPKYGRQFYFKQLLKLEPVTRQAVVGYISRWAPGIGPAGAGILFDKFGSDACKVLRTDPQQAWNVLPRVKWEKIQQASDALRSMAATEQIRMELEDLFRGRGFSHQLVDNCIKRWGLYAVNRIRRDPFCLLVARMPSCGFGRCDALYGELGLPPERMRRQLMCLWHAMREGQGGHTWFDLGWAEAVIKGSIGSVPPEKVRWKRAVRMGLIAGWLEMRQCGGSGGGGGVMIAEGNKARNEGVVAEKVREMLCKSGS